MINALYGGLFVTLSALLIHRIPLKNMGERAYSKTLKGAVFSILALCTFFFGEVGTTRAEVREYEIVLNKEIVNITGRPLEKITINGRILGPTLEFTEGDEAVIRVINRMNEDSSVHWHGLLVPGEMDGVLGFNGFSGIRSGEAFTYRFKIRQQGTYWYHAHSMEQKQDSHYGSIIIHPKDGNDIRTNRDYVVLLSDFNEAHVSSIMYSLNMGNYYNSYIGIKNFFLTLKDLILSINEIGVFDALKIARIWLEMGISPGDLADVNNHTFLINGKTSEQNWTALFKPGESVRLRFINASASSFYDVSIPGLKMTVISADGQPVEPVVVDEFRFGVAETYDVIVTPQDNRAYTIAAESIDRAGFVLATLAPNEGMKGPFPVLRSRNLLTLGDMVMVDSNYYKGTLAALGMHNDAYHGNSQRQISQDVGEGYKVPVLDFDTGVPGSGWAKASTAKGHRALAYKDLRYRGIQEEQRLPEREIIVELGGNTEGYFWTLNGQRYERASPINLTYGERVRLIFINNTMMAHPMHLHGMFVQLENGQPLSKLPNKHTVIVAPGDRYTALLTADELGEWAFHCHILYHMMAGMMRRVIVAKLDSSHLPAPSHFPKVQDKSRGAHSSNHGTNSGGLVRSEQQGQQDHVH